MELYDIIWRDKYVEKLTAKHAVSTEEVEDGIFNRPLIRFWEKGQVRGEDLYLAYGQAASGRYLVVFFIRKFQTSTLPISARDMTDSERRYYHGHKGN